jgi:aspartate-semialdehyde dehydrogenase
MRNTGTVSVVGGDSLLAKELRDVLAQQSFPAKINLVGVDDEGIVLTEQDGEPAILTPLDQEDLLSSRLIFLAGTASSSRIALAVAAQSATPPAIVDLTYVAEDEVSARLRAPMAEPPGHAAPAGSLHVIAHPAAIALALLLARMASKFPIRRSTAHVFEPVSELGQAGLEELRRQTVNLLSFQPLPKDVFDAQLAFALLARYGDDAPQALESTELRIERHLASLLASLGSAPMPSLRLVQAPVFHGHSISLHVEFDARPDLKALASVLASAGVDVRGPDLEPPNNVSVAGQSGIAVGAISADRNNPNACWLWAAADNFRLMADNALAVALPLLEPATDEGR